MNIWFEDSFQMFKILVDDCENESKLYRIILIEIRIVIRNVN